ncbi:MAG: hydantoinase/oxoprolinase family protein [Gammaproteobacteria bacterium]
MANNSGWRISVDTGGTFTDVVISDDNGKFTLGKALTTKQRIFVGLKSALESAAGQLKLPLETVLGRTELFVYGTTHATNAIVTGNIAKTAFLTTAGFPDVLVLREGGKFNPHDFSTPFPKPYIPRRHTFEIDERIRSGGDIYTPLDETSTLETLEKIKNQEFEACAVSLLWATVNPVHELRLGELINEHLPNLSVTLSHALNPILREYRRASSTAIDASIKPLMQTHLTDLQLDLRNEGYSGEILVSTTSGGCLDIESVVERPINSVRSGPAMAPVAGRHYASIEQQASSVLVVDTGGTTFDVSLVRDGNITITQETWLGERFTGHMLGVPAVDARSVGAGGGSIAWLDDAGLLRVGPQSAGADPGPACYAQGGKLPTVTDAAVVLGYIDPEYFLGGKMSLDAEAAVQAIATIATPLGISVEQAAYSIFAVSNETMINAIKEITVSEGIDPAESIIVAGGGAAGLGIVPIAQELGCQAVIVPRTASVLSACGMQFSDIQMEVSRSIPTRSDIFQRDAVNAGLEEIDKALHAFANKLAIRGFDQFCVTHRSDAHYAAQVWDLAIDLPAPRLNSEADVDDLCEAFHQNHERIFNIDDRASPIEFLNWTGRVSVALPQSGSGDMTTTKSARTDTERGAFFDLDDKRQTAILKGNEIEPNREISGPAIIEEETTTVVLPPGATTRLSTNGNYIIEWTD